MRGLYLLGGFFVMAGLSGGDRVHAAVVGGPQTFGGHTYYVISPNDWMGAQAEATTLGGDLVTINDAAENAFLVSTFIGTSTSPVWIGINDIAAEGAFSWISGEPVTYTNWHASEPNDYSIPPNGPAGEDDGTINWYGNVGGSRHLERCAPERNERLRIGEQWPVPGDR